MATMGLRLLTGILAAALLVIACGSPSSPSRAPRLIVHTPTPAPGSVIPMTLRGSQYYVLPAEGRISIPITVMSDRDVPRAQLDVFLFYGNGPREFCGQNLPDVPIWEPLSKGQTASVTVSGFQLPRPCEVTSIRAWLHTRFGRDTGLVGPPDKSQTIASGALTVNYSFR